MRINTKIVISIETDEVIERESFEYPDGRPVVQCCGGGPGGGGSAAGAASAIGEGDIAGAAPSGAVVGGGEAAAFGGAGPSGVAGTGPAAGTFGGGENAQVSFSAKGAEIGTIVGGLLGPAGAAVGGLVGGVIGSAAEGSGGGDMSGGAGEGIAGPDGERRKKAAAGIAKDKKPGEVDKGALEDVAPQAKKEEERKARKRPQTILTSPLGLRSRPTIKRATLLGG